MHFFSRDFVMHHPSLCVSGESAYSEYCFGFTVVMEAIPTLSLVLTFSITFTNLIFIIAVLPAIVKLEKRVTKLLVLTLLLSTTSVLETWPLTL